ncbi:MAG: GNAT family N-acetyltransferase [Granulosicoccus sp.]
MSGDFHHKQYNGITKQSISDSGWLDLFETIPVVRFYHHPDWFLAYDQHLSAAPLSLSVVEKNENTVALITWQGANNARRCSVPSHDHLSLSEPLFDKDLSLIETKEVIQGALSANNNQSWDWQFHNIPAHSALYSANLEQANWFCRQSRTSAWFDLKDEQLPPGGKLRRNLKRLKSKLAEKGEVSAQWVSAKEELGGAFALFSQLEASGWKAQRSHSTAIAHNPELLAFYKQLLTPEYPGLDPVITLLWIDDRCIAAQYALRTATTLSLLKIAYDEDYAQYSPGSLLLQNVITMAKTEGLNTVSLVTSPAWAERWHPQTEPVWHVTRYANNTGGLTLKTMDRLKNTARARLRPKF